MAYSVRVTWKNRQITILILNLFKVFICLHYFFDEGEIELQTEIT